LIAFLNIYFPEGGGWWMLPFLMQDHENNIQNEYFLKIISDKSEKSEN
jgi:hypothetical protein